MGVLRFNKRVEASVNSLGTFSKGECPPPHRYCSAKENMEKWYPIALVKLSEDIQVAVTKMTKPEKRVWDLISITPSKWIQHPWGDEAGGFWVVAAWGNNCLYYFDGFHDFISNLKTMNPSVELRGC
jgi:hypothetical protein